MAAPAASEIREAEELQERDLASEAVWQESIERSRRRREQPRSSRAPERVQRSAAVATAAVVLGSAPAAAAVGAGALADGGSAPSLDAKLVALAGEVRGLAEPRVPAADPQPAPARPAAAAAAGTSPPATVRPGAARAVRAPRRTATRVSPAGGTKGDGAAERGAVPAPVARAAAAPAPDGARRLAIARRGGGGVRSLQAALGLAADGVFGPATERALARWQRRQGLTPDGVAGPETRARLGLGPGRILERARRKRGGGSRRAGGGAGSRRSSVVRRVIAAANAIATKPYRYGGGHGSFTDSGYDCSGSVSYALHGGGLLSSPLDSTGLMSYGRPGPGRRITIYANPGHVYMVIDGRRFDTTARRQSGSRWSGRGRSAGGYAVRHPPGY